jgi:hypothetical protein
MKPKFILVALTFLLTTVLQAQDWSELQKTMPDKYLNNVGDQFGNSVSIDGNYAVIGVPGSNISQGCAYILFYNETDWETVAILTASDGEAIDYFGESVGISGDQIVVSAFYGNGNEINSGSVYVFEKPETGWTTMTETAKLTASDGQDMDNFGYSVSISGDNVVVGSYTANGKESYSGTAYVFEKPEGGWTDMTETAKLTASDGEASDYFGYSVSISDDVVVVGASQRYKWESGVAYVFEKPETGWITMTETAKFTASDGDKSDAFGYSVDIENDIVVIGAIYDDDNVTSSGSAYIFEKPETGWVTMTETAKLTAFDEASSDNIGSSVCISGDKIVVGAIGYNANAGSVYIYEKPLSGWTTMTETVKLVATDGEGDDEFGFSVGISGDKMLIGAYKDDDNGFTSGSVYAYKASAENEESFSFTQKIVPEKYMNFDYEYYGYSVSIDGNFAVVGANGYNNYQGRAYVLELNGSNWEKVAILTASDAEEGDKFGSSVCILGNQIGIGAKGNDSDAGCVYVFEKPLNGWANMTETAILTASDGKADSYFGNSISISEEIIVVGAYGDDENGTSTGAAYIFKKSGSSWENMMEIAKLTASDGEFMDRFGFSVAISGDDVVIGAYLDDDNGSASGSVYLFKKLEGGWSSMTETAKIISPSSESRHFGKSLYINDNTIVIGAPGNQSDRGSVYIFEKELDIWTETAYLKPKNRGSNDRFGISVAISGDNIIVGAVPSSAYYNIESPNESVYFFNKPIGGWTDTTETAKIDTTFVTEDIRYLAGFGFGYSLGISGNNVIIGSCLNGSSGSAFFYFLNYITGIEEVIQKPIAVYPNPTSNSIHIDASENKIQQITVYDISGKAILNKSNGQGSTQIDLSGFEKNIYILKIVTEDEIFTTKVVKK